MSEFLIGAFLLGFTIIVGIFFPTILVVIFFVFAFIVISWLVGIMVKNIFNL